MVAYAGALDDAVCEFSCSCCRGSTALAADAICSFLLADAGADCAYEALQDFISQANGLAAVQVCLCICMSLGRLLFGSW